MQANEKSVTLAGIKSGNPLSGIFATDNSKTISIAKDQPFVGFVTVSFTDESDPLQLNGQMFYCPTPVFNKAIREYLKGVDAD